MDIRLLRAFVTVAEQGSYHKAALALHITQPALSKQIQALELLIGGALFQRGRHGAVLTELGQQLYSKADELVKQHHSFLNYTREIQKKTTNSLLIGFGISSFNTVPGWINTFQSRYPNIEISVNHIPSSIQCKL
ncbi:LysR family transcriptional regulator [Klebsiella oxytoca]|uniref:LysR family transcriptional regulator n=1 Tax=Klebsiella oxytoca TaxID=571 RepID=UPI001D0FE2D2|nr:LysR family transcriptional regulator [Klebsiella oxytoca]